MFTAFLCSKCTSTLKIGKKKSFQTFIGSKRWTKKKKINE